MTTPAALSTLKTERHKIASLHVTHVDDLTQTETPITPARLSDWPSAFHHRAHDAATIDEALRLLEASHPESTIESFEVRWKLSIVDAGGAALLSVFHHSHEAYGYVGGTRVKFVNDGILHFLRHTFGVHEKTLDRM